jgi:hypothetical protein
MTLQGVVVNFAGLAATRFFLGLCEAGAFPVRHLFRRVLIEGVFLSLVYVVQTNGGSKTIYLLFQLYYPRRRIWRSFGQRNR